MVGDRARTWNKIGSSWQGLVAVFVCLWLILPPAGAQTAEQLEQLNQLSPMQRQALLEALQQDPSLAGQSAAQPLRESHSEPDRRSDLSPVVTSPDEPNLRADAGSRLVITFKPKDLLSEEAKAELESDPSLRRLVGSHAFVLDSSGVLSLQGIEVIPLLGLDERDIESRLGAEPYLGYFDIDVRILDRRPSGLESLSAFGYDLFEPNEATFDPPMTGPVPPDYVLGPGDTVRIQMFGNINSTNELDVTRDGILNVPEIGPVGVTGMTFSDFRADIDKRVRETLIGTQVSVTMGQLRTIRVFVLGDANRPGSYVVSGLATISSALYRSGGISDVGSLRRIQLKRNGSTVGELDLYDLLLNGDTSGDQRLQPGDVIFVPPIGTTITVGGAVNRPAIYELRDRASVADAVRIAGGLAADAFAEGARLERIGDDAERRVLSINLADAGKAAMRVRAGDILTIPKALPDLQDTVVLSGHVQRPGPYQWRAGMRLTDLIGSSQALKSGVDRHYLLIRRELDDGLNVQVVSADLEAALLAPGSDENILLQPRDTVFVFSLALGRQRIIQPMLEELRLQATYDAPFQQVEIAGNVRAPGTYPLEPGMRVSDLLRAGGNLAEDAYTLRAELTRYWNQDSSGRSTELIDIDLESVLRGDPSSDLTLQEHDYLKISMVPDWASTWTVKLDGEFRFPGAYRVRPGETLDELTNRAGGLTEEAFPEGAIFLRESLREREQEQIDLLTTRLEADLASLSLEAADTSGSETLRTGNVLLEQLRRTEAVGRLVVDPRHLNGVGNTAGDRVELRDGDRIMVPTRSQIVTVIGETQQNTSHLYQEGLTRDDYIRLSGGTTRRADKRLIYVVRANGAVIAGNRSRWFGRRGADNIRPGDTIVVPLATDRIRPLTFWTSVTQILAQAGIALAAIQSFDDN